MVQPTQTAIRVPSHFFIPASSRGEYAQTVTRKRESRTALLVGFNISDSPLSEVGMRKSDGHPAARTVRQRRVKAYV
jgi:hypothetical protein